MRSHPTSNEFVNGVILSASKTSLNSFIKESKVSSIKFGFKHEPLDRSTALAVTVHFTISGLITRLFDLSVTLTNFLLISEHFGTVHFLLISEHFGAVHFLLVSEHFGTVLFLLISAFWNSAIWYSAQWH
jgi:hypothetical protein